MSVNESSSGGSDYASDGPLPHSVRFWLLLTLDIPSATSSFIILICLLGYRTARHALRNHVIIVLIAFCLCTQLIDIPFYIAYIINSGVVKPSIPAICMLWWIIAIAIFNGQQVLLAWTAIERHILIFNDRWIRTKRGRFFGHYLPLILILSYLFIFNGYVYFFYPCENTYDYNLPVCNGDPCYTNDPFVGTWDLIANAILPGLLEPLASIVLIIRVIRQKRELSQGVQWRKHRKMVIQLMAVSILNTSIVGPLNILQLAYLFGLQSDYEIQVESYFYFFVYLIPLLIPFIFITLISEVFQTIKLIFRRGQQQITIVGRLHSFQRTTRQ
jgi:hypothetical protein